MGHIPTLGGNSGTQQQQLWTIVVTQSQRVCGGQQSFPPICMQGMLPGGVEPHSTMMKWNEQHSLGNCCPNQATITTEWRAGGVGGGVGPTTIWDQHQPAAPSDIECHQKPINLITVQCHIFSSSGGFILAPLLLLLLLLLTQLMSCISLTSWEQSHHSLCKPVGRKMWS